MNIFKLKVWLILFVFLSISTIDKAAVIDTSDCSSWTIVSRSDTVAGSISLFSEALNKLEYTIALIAEKTFSNVYLQEDSLTGWYIGKLGLKGHFSVLKHVANDHSGVFYLYGTGKIKLFSARLLIRFTYTKIDEALLYGIVEISVDKRFIFIDKLIDKEAKRTLGYMKIVGKNLLNDPSLQRQLREYGNTELIGYR